MIRRLRPDGLLTHGSSGEYGHPAHVQVHQAVVRAHQAVLAQANFAVPALYTFCAAIPGVLDRFWNAADRPDVVLDVTPWLDKKMAAAECHRSQYMAFFDGRPQARTLREALREIEGLHCVWSPDGCQPSELAEWECRDVPD
jgi:LmbE family N-acetylglucosaminyl deacetylase